MKPRRTEVTFDGIDVAGRWTEFTYSDPAQGEADSIDISVFDRDDAWLNAPPECGVKISAKIETKDWGNAPGGGTLDCGTLVLETPQFSGPPTKGTITAVSTPADSSFRETEKTKTWKNVTLEEIGKEIASNAGIALTWDVEDAPPAIQTIEQTEETDCSFFQSKCEEYGLCIKIYADKLVVYDREAYKKKDPIATLKRNDLESWSWKQKLTHTYTGGTYEYTIPIKKAKDKKVKVTVGDGPRWLHKSGKAESNADAERKIKAAINTANHGATKMSCTMMGRTDMVSGACVKMEGFGKFSGKYFIDSAEHSVSASSGYETRLELSLVEE